MTWLRKTFKLATANLVFQRIFYWMLQVSVTMLHPCAVHWSLPPHDDDLPKFVLISAGVGGAWDCRYGPVNANVDQWSPQRRECNALTLHFAACPILVPIEKVASTPFPCITSIEHTPQIATCCKFTKLKQIDTFCALNLFVQNLWNWLRAEIPFSCFCH